MVGHTLPVDIDLSSWGADRADNHGTHCSPGCFASCRCTMGLPTAPVLSAVVSPACDTWRDDFETTPFECGISNAYYLYIETELYTTLFMYGWK